MKWFFGIAIIGTLVATYRAKLAAVRYRRHNELSASWERTRALMFWGNGVAFLFCAIILIATVIYTGYTPPDPKPDWWAYAHGCATGLGISIIINMVVAAVLVRRDPPDTCDDVMRIIWILAWPMAIAAFSLLFQEVGDMLVSIISLPVAIISVFTT